MSRLISTREVLPRVAACLVAVLFCIVVAAPFASAGAPFRTDDPETVEFRHWEFSVAGTYVNDKDGISGTAPQLDADYGIAPDVQLHFLMPMAYEKPRGGPTLFGSGDLELGVKYRFIQETESRPMVAMFPIVRVPTGNSGRGLGNGHAQLFLPLWFQKSWGAWQSYAGGGYWINPGPDNRDYWFTGWLVQRDITKWLTMGAELFYNTPTITCGDHELGYNIGGLIKLTDSHRLLFSAGTDIHGQNLFSCYAGYLWTWGPPEKKR